MKYAWVACSMTEFGEHVGRYRHLVAVIGPSRYQLTTHCGHSASVEGIWRRNSTKTKCYTCETFEERS